MEKIFEEALEKSQMENDDFKRIAHESFDAIFHYLGKENFMRWIDKRGLSEHIEKMIIEEFSEEDMRNFPTCAGYYTLGTDRTRLRPKYINLDTNVHETYHMITDYRSNFSSFLDEGLTEYMKVGTQGGKEHYSYAQNVRFVSMLHKAMGDSLIKSYLMGVDRDTKVEILRLISEDGSVPTDNETIEAEYKKLNQTLGRIHEYYYGTSKYENGGWKGGIPLDDATKEDIRKNDFPKVEQMLQNMAVNYIRTKAQNLEFYRDGKLNASLIEKEIASVMKLLDKVAKDYILSMKKGENIFNEFYQRAIDAVIDASHLSVDNPELENIRQKLRRNYFDVLQGRIYYSGLGIEQMQKIFDENLTLLPLKLSKSVLDDPNAQAESLSQYMMKIALVIEKSGASETEKEAILSTYLFKRIPSGCDHQLIGDTIKKMSGITTTLQDRNATYQRDVVGSEFIEVAKDHFIEKRDNTYYLLFVDRDSNQIIEQKLPARRPSRQEFHQGYNGEWGKLGRIGHSRVSIFNRDAILSMPPDGYLYDIELCNGVNAENRWSFSIGFDDSFSNFFDVRGMKIDAPVLSGVGELTDYILAKEMSIDLIGKVKEGEYRSKGIDTHYEDDIYYPIKKAKTREFLENLGKLLPNIPESMQRYVVERCTREMLSHGSRNGDLESKYITLASRYFFDDKIKDVTEHIKKIEEVYASIGEADRECVKRSLVPLFFSTGEQKKKYFENVEGKRKARVRNEAKGFTIRMAEFIAEAPEDTSKYEPLRKMAGIRFFKSEVTRATRVNFEDFVREANIYSNGLPEADRGEAVKEIVYSSLYYWYGYDEWEDESVTDIVQKMQESLEKQVLQGEVTDRENLEEIERVIVSTCKIEKQGKYRVNGPIVRGAESIVKTVQENQSLSQEDKEKMVDGIIEQHNKTMSELAEAALRGRDSATRDSIREAMKAVSKGKEVDNGR